MWKTYGLPKALGIGLYDDLFYAEYQSLESAYVDLASVIRSVLKPKSACDFGCGNGFIIHYLKIGGVAVRGVEDSAAARRFMPAEVREDIVTASVVVPLSLGSFDITFSTEVAEHIPKAKVKMLIRNLAEHARSAIFFTAATPGQWGDGHINCQPRRYWEALFLKYGWFSNEGLREEVLSGIQEKPQIDQLIPWISKNLIIFTSSPERAALVNRAPQVYTVSVVIPSYNMDWCVTRAVSSCQAQSLAVDEIIIVDDCSTDNTEAVVRDLMTRDPRIKYFRQEKNGGHLAALRFGALQAASDWIALLDADDELTPNSIEARVVAANEYRELTGLKPQLVYGDHVGGEFPRLKGHAFPYLCKYLWLCQTSTMMLGRECIPYFPVSDNPCNTDDEIVLAIGKHFHILHSDAAVAVYHEHNNPTQMTGDAKRVFRGTCQLVRDHRADIIRERGIGCILMLRLRLLKDFVDLQVILTNVKIVNLQSTLIAWYWRILLRAYRNGLSLVNLPLRAFLKIYF
jgi:glycosyltransferase involved in cell wall biosynthesis